MIRVLVFGMTENPGGVESFLINYYRHIDRDQIQFDFLCNSFNPVAYEDELIELGGRTFHFTARSKNWTKYYEELNELFKQHASEWDAVWVNVCSLANIDYLLFAKKYGIKKRIIHSHNSQNMDSRLRGLLHLLNRRRIHKYASDFWACSEDAAIWFYNKELIKKAIVINNAIDVKQMLFNEEKRKQIRKEHDWDDKYIIGNIGRLHFQKNQNFIIDVFQQYHADNPDSMLVLIGKGEDESDLKQKVDHYGLNESVYFAGIQKDIQGWLSSFDFFLFPSKFEGASIAALEAQANGLPVLGSKRVIPEDIRINDNFIFFDLDKDCSEWADQIRKMEPIRRKQKEEIIDSFIKAGYEITEETKRLQQLFEN